MTPTEIIVALDLETLSAEDELLSRLHGTIRHYKIGLRMFTAFGRRAVELVHKHGGDVFLDLKLHDIPQTVAHAVQEAHKLGVFSVSLHTSGGADMLRAAHELPSRPKLWGVTVLTSLCDADVKAIHPRASVRTLASRLAVHAQPYVDGIICSGKEVPSLREELGENTCFITPGIRRSGGAAHDQKRMITPAEAARLDIRYIVVGRPITQAQDPLKAADDILAEIRNAGPVRQ
ncbi:MAG: orotidine-5'-phosphate decarboxylase [Elusimicrobiota bacterium]|jgi:orotidine-5'-phosphate decarboxylase